jgi:hypothetical protein
MNNGAGRQHLRVKPRAPAHQTVEHAAMPVGPIHHGCHGKAIILIFQQFILLSNGMNSERVHSKLDEIAHVCTRFDLSVHT